MAMENLAFVGTGSVLLAAVPWLPPSPGGIAGTVFTVFVTIGFAGWGLSKGFQEVVKLWESRNVKERAEFAAYRAQAAADLAAANKRNDRLVADSANLVLATDRRIADQVTAAEKRVDRIRDDHAAFVTLLIEQFDAQLAENRAALRRTLESLEHAREIASGAVDAIKPAVDAVLSHDRERPLSVLQAEADAAGIMMKAEASRQAPPEDQQCPPPTATTGSKS